MRSRSLLVIAATVLVVGAGGAMASHVATVNPNAVPAGYLAAHNDVANIEIDSFARAVKHGRADATLRHFVFPAGAGTLIPVWRSFTVGSGTFGVIRTPTAGSAERGGSRQRSSAGGRSRSSVPSMYWRRSSAKGPPAEERWQHHEGEKSAAELLVSLLSRPAVGEIA